MSMRSVGPASSAALSSASSPWSVLVGGIIGVAFKKIFSKVHFQKPLSQVLAGQRTTPTGAAKPNTATGGGAAGGGGTAKNILILGVDSRLGENSAFQVKGAPGADRIAV